MLLAADRSPCAKTAEDSDNADKARWMRGSMAKEDWGGIGWEGGLKRWRAKVDYRFTLAVLAPSKLGYYK